LTDAKLSITLTRLFKWVSSSKIRKGFQRQKSSTSKKKLLKSWNQL